MNGQHQCASSTSKIKHQNNQCKDDIVAGQALVLSPKTKCNYQEVGEPSSESPPPITLNSKQLKNRRKREKLRINRMCRNPAHNTFSNYMEFLKKNKMMGPNTHDNENPSYSIMHSLSEGFSVVLYTGTHGGLTSKPICRNAAIRLILGPAMIVMWRENLLHSGAKSRTEYQIDSNQRGKIKQDLRFFAYVQSAHKKGTPRSKKRSQTADGSQIYRLVLNLCEQFKTPEKCNNCSKGATTIDLSNITGYQAGETIMGNLVACGWVVLRGVEVSDGVMNKISTIASKGNWNSISTETNREMKYNSTSTTPKTWNDIELVQFQADITKKLLSRLLPSKLSFRMTKFNLLRNVGLLETDQDPHFDYPPRLIK